MRRFTQIICWILIIVPVFYGILIDSYVDSLLREGENPKDYNLSLFGETAQMWWYFVPIGACIVLIALNWKQFKKEEKDFLDSPLNTSWDDKLN